jgi:hypothetical protein
MLKLNAKSWVVGLLAALLSTSSLANFEGMFDQYGFHPFIGIDGQYRHMNYDDNFGDNVFDDGLPQFDVYAGLRFCKYWGLSIGFENSRNEERTARLVEGDYYLGFFIPAGSGTETHLTHAKIKGTHVDLMGFYPICPRYNVDLLLTIGVVRNTLYLDDLLFAVDDIPVVAPAFRSYKVRDTHARASVGLQHLFHPNFGVRGLVAWENTSEFDNLKPQENPAAVTDVKLKNSFIYSIGVFATV